MGKIWVNSGDSHILEPETLWQDELPRELAERAPRSEVDGEFENVYVDGEVLRRRRPTPVREGEFKGMRITELGSRPPGARNVRARLADLDEEGVWGEVVYPSLGLWLGLVKDPVLFREGVKVANVWAASEIMGVTPRLVPPAQVSVLSCDDAVSELERAASLGFKAINLPTRPPQHIDDWNRPSWDPLWSAAEEASMVICFHIGTDAIDPSKSVGAVVFGGPGGAILNYVETTYGGQRAATKMVSSGALERHPDLKVLISEGGATWVPFLGDRMNEAYRQHGMYVKPQLSMLPSEYLYRQVYVSFQHDRTAVSAYTANGYHNILWGSDYPHIEGTFGHTQKTLHELFDDVNDEVRYHMTIGSFLELFPSVGPPSAHAKFADPTI
jgi:predicted TIM-barrel fold metal-dependent hydrolase